MASLFRKTGSEFWYAAFRGPLNERVQRTTKKKKKSEAMVLALEWERAASAGRQGVLTEAHCRKVLSEILERVTTEPMNNWTCRAWLDHWLTGKTRSTSGSTSSRYKQVIDDFLEHLGRRADQPLAAISMREISSFQGELAAAGRSPVTVNQTIRQVLSAPFKRARELGFISINPCVAVERMRDVSKSVRKAFNAEQIGKLLSTAGDDWKGMVLCGYYTGLRINDCANLTWAQIDLGAAIIKVQPKKTEGHDDSDLQIPIHPELAAWLRSRTRGIAKAPLFPKLAGKKTNTLGKPFKKLMAKAKIVRSMRDASGLGRRTADLSFHSLRHSFVSALANAGVAMELRQKLSGHADEESHIRYTALEISTLKNAIALLPAVGAS